MHGAALDARASVAMTDRFSIEPFVTYGRRSIPISQYASNAIGGDTVRTEGYYGVTIHQRLRSTTHSGFHAYLSYGLTGTYYKNDTPQRQFFYGRTVATQPASSQRSTQGMVFPSVGVGVRKTLGSHLAMRADADVVTFFGMPLGVRASVGVVVPIGANK
jgi:hypothetical protein